MKLDQPQEFGRMMRWIHPPLLIIVAGIVIFIRLFFQTGNWWLGIAAIAARFGSLLANFMSPLNLNYREIRSLRKLEFLGESMSVVQEAVLNHWNRLAELSSLLLILFVVDASIKLWRKGGGKNRRRALVVGGSVVGFVLIAAAHSLLIHLSLIQSPYIISFSFLAIALAMAHELSHDIINAAQLSVDIAENQNQMRLAATAARLALWTWEIQRNRIWVTPEGREVYGVPADEELSIERFLATVHANDQSAVRHALDAALAGSGDFGQDYRIVLPDGNVRWISSIGKVEFKDGVVPVRMRGVSRDSSLRHEAEERMLSMVEAAPYALLMVDAAGCIVLINRQVETIFGYTRTELLGQPIGMLLPDRYRGRHEGLFHGFVAAPETRQMGQGPELTGRRKDGTEFPLEVGLNLVESAGETQILASIADITERKQAELEAAQHRSELAHLSRVNTLGQLSAALAHELNQPLSIILSNAQAAQRMLGNPSPPMEELRDILTDIVEEDRRAGEVIKRLRQLLKRGESELAARSLNDVLRVVLRLTHSELLNRGVIIETVLADPLPDVLGDEVQLQQVVLNLILNASDAMENLPDSDRHLRLHTHCGHGKVRLSVEDCGCGLPDSETEQIFQPFFTTKTHGMGIGLSICQSIVEAHLGRLWAEPNPVSGTTFHLELPALAPDLP